MTKSLGLPTAEYNKGKGTIVDSGTTDTYLPVKTMKPFKDIFRAMSGMEYHNAQQSFTREALRKLPVVVYRLQAKDSEVPIDVEMPAESYSEPVGGDRFHFRIYLNEPIGMQHSPLFHCHSPNQSPTIAYYHLPSPTIAYSLTH